MGYDELHDIAERFWKGETSEAEEQKLKERLCYGEVPDNLQDLADYLRFQDAQRAELSLGDDFDRKMLEEVERRSGRVFQMPQIWKIAASIALLIGFVGLMKVIFDPIEPTGTEIAVEVIDDTYQDPERAYQEVKQALMLVSKKMNKSSSAAQGLSLFNQAEQELQAEPKK